MREQTEGNCLQILIEIFAKANNQKVIKIYKQEEGG